MANDLTKGNLTKHFKNIGIPASVGFLFNTFYNVVDTFYAGRLGTESLAGLTISFPIFFLLLSLSTGLGNGTSALCAVEKGKDQPKEFHIIAKNALLIAVILGIIIPVFSPFYLDALFRLTQAEQSVIDIGMIYTQTIIIGIIFFMINNTLYGILKSQGITKPYRNFLIGGFLLNIILDPLFMFGWLFIPEFGVQGVALATILIQAFGNVYLGYHVIKSDYVQKKYVRPLQLKLTAIKDIFNQSIPASLNSATVAIGVFIINYYVVKYGGSSTVAAYGVAVRIEQIALIPTLGLNVAVLSIVGQNYGAEQLKRIKKTRKKATIYGVIMMLIGTAIIVPLAPYLIQLFDSSPDVVDAGKTYLRIEAIAFTTYVFINVNNSTIQGIKKPRFAIILGVYRQLLPFGLFYLMGTIFGLGIYGVWWGIVIINWSAVLISHLYTTYRLNHISYDRKDDQETTAQVA